MCCWSGVLGRTTTTVDVSNSSDEQAIALNQDFEAIEQAGFGQLSDSLRIDDDTGEFVGLSAMYDNMDYFVGGEWTSIEVAESFANKDVAFYVTAGARLGKWTPSLTYEKFESDVDIKFADQIDAIATSGLPTNIAQTITGIAVGVQASQESSYSVTSATLRYDLDASIALKADISKVDDDIANNDGTLMRFALNYVF